MNMTALRFQKTPSVFTPFFWTTLWLLCIGGLSNPLDAAGPNVVVILVDDLGLKDIGIEGSSYYQTPHIDWLARSGMRFTNGYANCQVCSPSRASIQLGQFPARHGITDWIGAAAGNATRPGEKLLPPDYGRTLPADDVTLAEAMREAGYRTFFAGKWHLGGEGSLPTDHGFEINRGGLENGNPPGGYFAPFNNPNLEDRSPGESLTMRLAAETSDFIRDSQSGSQPKPFFAMLSFYAVHSPVQTTQMLWDKYRVLASERSGNRFLIDRTLPVRQVQDHPVYAGMMETLDDAVGNVLETLDQTGLTESTIVVFTSDNGGVSSGDAYSTSNLPLRGGKGRQWEGGIREPYYIRCPGLIAAQSVSDLPVTGADLYPTVLELCGLPARPEQHVDGRSLAGVLKGEPSPELVDRPLVWHYPHYGNQGGEPSSILRRGDYKLIHYYEVEHQELYNLADDIGEQNDLSSAEPQRVASMKKELMEYLESVDARFPEPDSRFSEQQQKAREQRIRDSLLPQLEAEHAALLESDYQPNPTWWGSSLE